jgi:uncharacterized protein
LIAVDTNVLIHAHQREASLHPQADACVRSLAESATPWAICHHSLVEFYGVVTQPRLWKQPSTPREAVNQMEAWLESPSLRLLHDQLQGLQTLTGLLIEAKVTGARVHDARIAACCLHHGVTELWTVDRDFSRFPALKTRNPLV